MLPQTATFSQNLSVQSVSPTFTPVLLLEVEISQPIPDIKIVFHDTGPHYQRARSLVRLHTCPIGYVDLDVSGGFISSSEYAARIWDALRGEIIDHLTSDNLAIPTMLDEQGYPCTGRDTPACIGERERLLNDAAFVSVIIATRDRAESLARCLQSFSALHYPCYELIIVDNNPSSDATAAVVARASLDNTTIRYVSEEHPGLGWARNAGLRHARGTIIAFTDDDVIVDPHWLSSLVSGFAADMNVGCVTGCVVAKELETQAQLDFEEYAGFNRGFVRRVFDLRQHRGEHPFYPYRASIFGSGANMAFTANVLRHINGFDPVMGSGRPNLAAEDMDAFFRVVDGGFKIVYEPSAIVHHFHRRDYQGLLRQHLGYGLGMTAFLTKCVISRPRHTINVLKGIPLCLAWLARSRSRANRRQTDNRFAELARAETRGFLYGPFLYFYNLYLYRRSRLRPRE